jgi:hypothetical protein
VIHNPVGNIELKLDLATDENNVLTGTATGNGMTAPIDNGSVDGDDLAFSVTIRNPMKLTFKFALTMSGDTIAGTSKGRMFPAAKVTGSRSSA